ncbi:unnamed protein product [Nezara viridula]|uniref:Zinc finger PHD-type domain-containing protein n=1 Tax=Nezara viridula TaxID=85310 RepID=A0A9P0GZG7_NEZVI|nr:unnamed protein product [Nezara viridula]
MACTVPTCQAIFHGKCLNADESEFEALRALRKNWECPKCEKARKNIQPTDKCLSPPRSAPQQQTVDSTSQLLLAAIKNLTEEVKGLKFSLDANANESGEIDEEVQGEAEVAQTAVLYEGVEDKRSLLAALSPNPLRPPQCRTPGL